MAGDLCLFALINTVLDLDARALGGTPKLRAWYDALAAHAGVAKLLAAPGVEAYFQRVQ